jgi:hypoxanthine phosphoribosyltransferase
MRRFERKLVLTWQDVDVLIDRLLPQFRREFTAMVLITRGGLVPGGLLAEPLQITDILTASVYFPNTPATERLFVWPDFLQFPSEELLRGRPVLVVDDVWGSGRTITAVKDRILAAGGYPELCVLHYNPYRSLFTKTQPDYYAEITDSYVLYPWESERGAKPEASF